MLLISPQIVSIIKSYSNVLEYKPKCSYSNLSCQSTTDFSDNLISKSRVSNYFHRLTSRSLKNWIPFSQSGEMGHPSSSQRQSAFLLSFVFYNFLCVFFSNTSDYSFPSLHSSCFHSCASPLPQIHSFYISHHQENTSQGYKLTMAKQGTIRLVTNPHTTAGWGNLAGVKGSQGHAKESELPPTPTGKSHTRTPTYTNMAYVQKT